MNRSEPKRYRVMQLGPPDERNIQRNIPVTDLDSLVTHHPRANANARLLAGIPDAAENSVSRSYAVIGGEFQEVQALRTDRKYRSLEPHQVLIIKDFILDDTSAKDSRRVDVPSPLAGTIGRVDAANGVVDVHETADGPLVARIRHLGPIAVKPGDTVEYGQSLGTQNNIGLGPAAGKHVHIEMDTRHYQALDHYLLDMVEGRLPVAAEHRRGVVPRPVVDDGIERVGESGPRVETVQRALVALGYRGSDDVPIEVDGIYRLSMQGAVLRFQQEQGLAQSGDVDAPTWNAALELTLGRRIVPPPVVDALPPPPPAQQRMLDRIRGRLGNLDGIDEPGIDGCARERAACALLRLALEHRLEHVDHVLLGERQAHGGMKVFLVEGRLDDPAQRRTSMPLAEALDTPVDQSMAGLRRFEPGNTATHSEPEPALQLARGRSAQAWAAPAMSTTTPSPG